MSLGDLQAFITDQEKLAIRWTEREDSPVMREFDGNLGDGLRRKHGQEPGKNGARGRIVR